MWRPLENRGCSAFWNCGNNPRAKRATGHNNQKSIHDLSSAAVSCVHDVALSHPKLKPTDVWSCTREQPGQGLCGAPGARTSFFQAGTSVTQMQKTNALILRWCFDHRGHLWSKVTHYRHYRHHRVKLHTSGLSLIAMTFCTLSYLEQILDVIIWRFSHSNRSV